MNIKKVGLIIGAIIIVLLTIYRIVNTDRSGLALVECNQDKYVDTYINFYVDADVLVSTEEAIIKNRLDKFVITSNEILRKSCVPLKRHVGEIKFIDTSMVDLNEIRFSDPVAMAKNILESAGYEGVIEQHDQQPGVYLAIIYGNRYKSRTENFDGMVNFNLSKSAFILSYSTASHILEHELGHLAGALHQNSDIDYLKKHYIHVDSFIKSYTGGYKCSGKTTLMYTGVGGSGTFLDNLKLYSSPDIKFNGKPCGDEANGDNRRIMIEHSIEIDNARKGL
ncbi:hypothetical protein CW749_08600 [Vibrio sp. vnigr-6D03]|uniref:hypothetical protein n=1 Tax=Vibrio sp. vnigr-6D03 TaxID=2058088 RepID=UPI000C32F799|nr:hypothetical protein [Vibrio sp. vnigr-6D03]PKF79754.1 hypothetical protein CW749_08600 [Vibrio sp. vnigr-6D03]